MARFLRATYRTALFLATTGLVLMALGAMAIPLAGWGAAYVFAIGLWSLVAASLPAIILAIGALAHRIACGEWHFGRE